MDLRQALFKAIVRAEVSAKELSERAQVTPTQISRFRNGKDVSSSTLQRLIDALPADAYEYFHSLLASKRKSDLEIAEQLFELASQLRQSSISKRTEQRCARSRNSLKDSNNDKALVAS